MAVDVTRSRASVGASMSASSTVSTATWPRPRTTTALMSPPQARQPHAEAGYDRRQGDEPGGWLHPGSPVHLAARCHADGPPRTWKHTAPIGAHPQPHQRNEPDDRYDDVGDDAAGRIEARVQDGDEEVGSDDAPGEAQVASPRRRGEDDAADDRRPHSMTDRRQDAPDELGRHDRGQRQGDLLAVDDEERHERVAAALQRGETEADRRAQHYAIPGVKPADPPRDEDDQHRLDELLDQTDFEVAEETGAHQV